MEQNSTHKWTDMNIGMIVTCVIVGSLLVLGVVIPGVQALWLHLENRFIEKTVVAQANQERVNHELEETNKIQGPAHWINQDKKIVSIPIGQAEQLYLSSQPAESK